MNYQIKIVKTEQNTNYKEELAQYKKENMYNRDYNDQQPKTEFIKDVLICELSEDQFKKVKAEIMKVFE